VVIGIEAHVLKVVVLAPGPYAFLGIGRPGRIIGAGGLIEENRNKLIHPGIGKQQAGGIGQQGGGGHDGMPFFLKKIEKALSDL
jgi:hypothetical protein